MEGAHHLTPVPLVFPSLKLAESVMWWCWAPQIWMTVCQSQFVCSAPCSVNKASVYRWTSGAGTRSAKWGLCHGFMLNCWSWTGWVAELCSCWTTRHWREQRSGLNATKRRSRPREKTGVSLRWGRLTPICSWPPCTSYMWTSSGAELENVLCWWNSTPVHAVTRLYQSFFRSCCCFSSLLRLRLSWQSLLWEGLRGAHVESDGQG